MLTPEKIKWACELSQQDWNELLRKRNQYLIHKPNSPAQSQAKRQLLELIENSGKEKK